MTRASESLIDPLPLMQWKVSSSLAVITSTLLSAGDLVLAQISVPTCTAAGWSWVRLCCLFFMLASLRSTHSRTTLLTKIRVQLQDT